VLNYAASQSVLIDTVQLDCGLGINVNFAAHAMEIEQLPGGEWAMIQSLILLSTNVGAEPEHAAGGILGVGCTGP
jgi:hypothetical protein